MLFIEMVEWCIWGIVNNQKTDYWLHIGMQT